MKPAAVLGVVAIDQGAFYAIVSGINFTLLGLWWVAVKDRPDITGRDSAGRRMAYIVSLQFSLPGTIALLGQVAPDQPALWRSTFTIAALAGAAGTLLLSRTLREETRYRVLTFALWWVVVPIYALIAVVAAWEGLPDALNLRLSRWRLRVCCSLSWRFSASRWRRRLSWHPVTTTRMRLRIRRPAGRT